MYISYIHIINLRQGREEDVTAPSVVVRRRAPSVSMSNY